MKLRQFLFCFLIISPGAFAQVSSGRVESLVAAENYFSGITGQLGINKAFLMVADPEGIIFRPGPFNIRKYFKNQDDTGARLTWEPTLAKLSRSGDWGYTSGPFIYRPDSASAPVYGQYLSVWKTDKNNVWKLALDISVTHAKPIAKPKLKFSNPDGAKFFRQWSDNRQQQREDIVMITDNLFTSTQKKYGNLAYNEFLSDDARFLFPGSQPVEGKYKVQDFLRSNEIKIITQAAAANRAFSGELAYTYGTSQVSRNGRSLPYHYVRIWEAQDDKWYVIVEVHTPAKG